MATLLRLEIEPERMAGLRRHGQSPVQIPESLSLNDLIGAALPGLEQRVPARIALGVELKPGLPVTVADARQVRRVLTHLVVDAAQAIGPRAGRIRISTGEAQPRLDRLLPIGVDPDPPSGRYAYFEVADDAHEANSARRLSPFDRRTGSRRAEPNRGLVAVVGTVRSHGGLIEVDFPPLGGITWRVLLPAREVPLTGGASVRSPRAGSRCMEHWRK